MSKLLFRRILPPLGALLLIGAGSVYLASLAGANQGPLRASGTIESIQVGVASEVSGRVSEVLVEEGQTVSAGDPLIRLDGRLLEVQRASAMAAGESAVAAAQLQQIEAQQALDNLISDAPLAAAQAELALANARDALDDAQRDYAIDQEGHRGSTETVKGAKAKLALQRERMEHAKSVYDNARGELSDGGRKASAYLEYVNARNAYNLALSSYNWYTGHPTEIAQAQNEAEVAVARAQVDDAERKLEDLRPGPEPDALALGRAGLTLAQAQLAAAQAKARLDLETLDIQLEKLLLRAPSNGVVTVRSLEPGEVLAAGASALSIGQLDHLTITVYLPEDRYGEVSLGDEATISVDAFPGETFRALVVRIADQAEYTPRNVQTEEGRRTTVFAVELAVDDLSGRLKPGMPADVVFLPSP